MMYDIYKINQTSQQWERFPLSHEYILYSEWQKVNAVGVKVLSCLHQTVGHIDKHSS